SFGPSARPERAGDTRPAGRRSISASSSSGAPAAHGKSRTCRIDGTHLARRDRLHKRRPLAGIEITFLPLPGLASRSGEAYKVRLPERTMGRPLERRISPASICESGEKSRKIHSLGLAGIPDRLDEAPERKHESGCSSVW